MAAATRVTAPMRTARERPPRLAGLKRPYPEFVKIVRDGVGEMPPHSKDDVSDEQLAVMYKGLTELPPKGEGRTMARVANVRTHLRRAG